MAACIDILWNIMQLANAHKPRSNFAGAGIMDPILVDSHVWRPGYWG
jgi:hypothetical protein